MELHSNNKKPLYSREGKMALICWNEQEEILPSEGGKDIKMYKYSYIRIPYPFTYESLVSSIIRSEYNDDRMQAVINNYLDNPTDEKRLQEFTDMQNWRKEAKEVAHEVIDNL